MRNSNLMKSIYLKYHWTLFFFQWLRFRINIFFLGIRTVIWAIRKKHKMTFRRMADLTHWNSWREYKANGSYLLKRNGDLWIIEGCQFNDVLSCNFKNDFNAQ